MLGCFQKKGIGPTTENFAMLDIFCNKSVWSVLALYMGFIYLLIFKIANNCYNIYIASIYLFVYRCRLVFVSRRIKPETCVMRMLWSAVWNTYSARQPTADLRVYKQWLCLDIHTCISQITHIVDNPPRVHAIMGTASDSRAHSIMAT